MVDLSSPERAPPLVQVLVAARHGSCQLVQTCPRCHEQLMLMMGCVWTCENLE